MKKLIYLMAIVASVSVVHAQANTDNIRKVSSRGYAERELTPDIIYLSISLKEYYQDGNSRRKMTIDALEKDFINALVKHGIPNDDISIQNIYSYNNNGNNTRKKVEELLQSRQYRVKVSDLSRLNSLFERVDSRSLESTAISEYDHSQKKQIEKELKVEAVKDARNNAEILASADGQSVGKAILLNDNSSFNWNDIMPTARMSNMLYAKGESSDLDSENMSINIRPIKLVSNIDAVFELK